MIEDHIHMFPTPDRWARCEKCGVALDDVEHLERTRAENTSYSEDPSNLKENVMQNPVRALKQNVHNNPKPYIIAATTVGVVVGVVVTKKLSKPPVKTDFNSIVQAWVNHMDELGKNVYVMPKELHEPIMALLDN